MLSRIIAVLGNTLGLVAILFITYLPFISTGTIGYTEASGIVICVIFILMTSGGTTIYYLNG